MRRERGLNPPLTGEDLKQVNKYNTAFKEIGSAWAGMKTAAFQPFLEPLTKQYQVMINWMSTHRGWVRGMAEPMARSLGDMFKTINETDWVAVGQKFDTWILAPMRKVKDLVGGWQNLTIALTGLLIAKPILQIMTGLVQLLSGGPLIWALGAFAYAGFQIYQHWDQIGPLFKDRILPELDKLKSKFGDLIGMDLSKMSWSELWTDLQEAAIQEAISTIDELASALKRLNEAADQLAAGKWGAALAHLLGIGEGTGKSIYPWTKEPVGPGQPYGPVRAPGYSGYGARVGEGGGWGPLQRERPVPGKPWGIGSAEWWKSFLPETPPSTTPPAGKGVLRPTEPGGLEWLKKFSPIAPAAAAEARVPPLELTRPPTPIAALPGVSHPPGGLRRLVPETEPPGVSHPPGDLRRPVAPETEPPRIGGAHPPIRPAEVGATWWDRFKSYISPLSSAAEAIKPPTIVVMRPPTMPTVPMLPMFQPALATPPGFSYAAPTPARFAGTPTPTAATAGGGAFLGALKSGIDRVIGTQASRDRSQRPHRWSPAHRHHHS